MDTHFSRVRDRRSKGRTKWPEIYLGVEILAMLLIEYIVYMFGYKFLTILVALVLVFFLLISSIPRYKRVIARQERKKIINNSHRVKK
jgi:prepilin signal peptidase PulO-like enzyme (type II secretory pathway)